MSIAQHSQDGTSRRYLGVREDIQEGKLGHIGFRRGSAVLWKVGIATVGGGETIRMVVV